MRADGFVGTLQLLTLRDSQLNLEKVTRPSLNSLINFQALNCQFNCSEAY